MKKESPQRKGPVKISKTETKKALALSNSTAVLLSLAGLVLVTLFVYSPCYKATFINWDEKRYLFETPFIQKLSWENIRAIFSEKVLLSYNPLVSLSFAIDFSMVGQKPPGTIF
jgi:hypothetical protein